MALPTNLANGDLITEGWVDSVTNSIAALDNATSAAFLAAIKAALDSRYVSQGARFIATDAAQSIDNGVITPISWGTEVTDPDGWTSGGASQLGVPAGKGGLYHFSYTGQWAGSPGVTNGVACRINGAYIYADESSGLWGVATLSFARTLVAGTEVDFSVYQNSGAALGIVSRVEITPG